MTQEEYNNEHWAFSKIQSEELAEFKLQQKRKYNEHMKQYRIQRLKTIIEEIGVGIGDIITNGNYIIRVENIYYSQCVQVSNKDGVEFNGIMLTKQLKPRKDGQKWSIMSWNPFQIVKRHEKVTE